MSSKLSKKKRSKTPEKVRIKTEKKFEDEIHTMEYYVGDPVELIQQVFASLNAKTIKNLSPEFLKDSSIREIEELCLNELLGISSKRLKSIINATKCPSDTESSESDVENIEEHVSLEEISSDSDHGKSKNSMKKVTAKRKDVNNKTLNDGNKANGTEKFSVLELLELQARARAIRSQLALEPIAKIEVNSDDTDENQSDSKSKKSTQLDRHKNLNNKKPIQTNSSNLPTSSAQKPKDSSTTVTTTTAAPAATTATTTTTISSTVVNGFKSISSDNSDNRPRKIKLKRNFRKRSVDIANKPFGQTIEKNLISNNNAQETLIVEKHLKNDDETTNLPKERSLSPDVLTILPHYETLCISDSDENDTEKNKFELNQQKRLIEKIVIDDFKTTNETEQLVEIINGKLDVDSVEKEDLEDGEIIDNQNKNSNTISIETEQQTEETVQNTEKCENETENETENFTPQIISNIEIKPADENIEKSNNDNDLNDDDNHNDDIISLGDEDFDYEMHDHIDEIIPKIEKIDKPIKGKKDDDEEKFDESTDFIELHDSSEDEPDDKYQNQGNSWNSRWLQSDKVSKILATSKLGNRVRHKIKSNKKAEQIQQKEQQQLEKLAKEEQATKMIPKVIFSSNFEDGSIQQYKEIQNRDKNTKNTKITKNKIKIKK